MKETLVVIVRAMELLIVKNVLVMVQEIVQSVMEMGQYSVTIVRARVKILVMTVTINYEIFDDI
jgi:hypothetical protein